MGMVSGTEIQIVKRRTLRNTRKPWQRFMSSPCFHNKKKIWSMKAELRLRKYQQMIRNKNGKNIYWDHDIEVCKVPRKAVKKA